MTTPLLFGSLILDASTKTPTELRLPFSDYTSRLEGVYPDGRSSGRWLELYACSTKELLMPSRNKNLLVRCSSELQLNSLLHDLSTLDSDLIGQIQLYKLNKLIESYADKPDFVSVVNISSSENSTSSNIGFYLLSNGIPIYVCIVYDLHEHSARLTWCTEDIKPILRKLDLTRYAFYMMPTLLNASLFIPTQFVCSRWYKFGKHLGKTKNASVTMCNALEVMLYKNHKD